MNDITQADRDAAAELLEAILGRSWLSSCEPTVQAFARHRIATRPSADAAPVEPSDIVELVDALRGIASLRQHSREDDADNAATMQDMAERALAKHGGAK